MSVLGPCDCCKPTSINPKGALVTVAGIANVGYPGCSQCPDLNGTYDFEFPAEGCAFVLQNSVCHGWELVLTRMDDPEDQCRHRWDFLLQGVHHLTVRARFPQLKGADTAAGRIRYLYASTSDRQPTTVIDRRGNRTSFTWDSAGQLTSERFIAVECGLRWQSRSKFFISRMQRRRGNILMLHRPRNQCAFMPRMSRLPAAFLLRLWVLPVGPGMRMLCTRWQRGILRRFALPARFGLQIRNICLQSSTLSPEFRNLNPELCNLSHQRTNDRLGLRPLTRNQNFRDFQRHPRGVANPSIQVQISSRPVNGSVMNLLSLRVHLSAKLRTQRGWTLVELLVVLFVIGLLLSLLIPAVQSAREAARRTTCRSQLKQLGLAMHSYHELHKIFPPGNTNSFSAFAVMLPFLDQANLYQQISFSHDPYRPPNQELIGHDLKFLRCPSDSGVRDGAGQTNYVANNGAGLHVNGQVQGVFSLLRHDPVNGGGPISASSVTDGLSNTAAFSELLVGNDTQHPMRAVWKTPRFPDPSQANAMLDACKTLDTRSQRGDRGGRGRPWIDGNYPSTLYNHMATPNTRACTNSGAVFFGTYPASSLHSTVVFVCLADGSVRQVSESVSLGAWRALGTRGSSDEIGEF